jgi:hypothetical protein
MGQIDFDGSNSTVKADVIRGQTGTTVKLGGVLDTDGNYIQTEKGGDLTSASPLVIDTDGDYFDVTGTTNFAAMTVAADRQFTLQFDGVLTMTHHATNLDLPGEANITTAAGDVATFQSTGSNTVQCINYTKADGTGIAGGGDFSDGGDAGGAARTLGNTDAYDLAFETNNVEQLQIEGNGTAGIITMPNQSSCNYTRSTFTVATATLTRLSFSTKYHDVHDEFDDATNYRFTATNAGVYIFMTHATIDGLGDGKTGRVRYNHNGGEYDGYATVQETSSGGTNTSCNIRAIKLAASDYIEAYTYHDHGSDRNCYAWFSVAKVS